MGGDASEHPDRVVSLDAERARRFLRFLKSNAFVTLMYVDGELTVYMKGCDDEDAKDMMIGGLAALMHH